LDGSAKSRATIIARWLERLTWRSRAVCPLVSAVLARGVCAEIPLFLVGQLFFRKLAAMDILSIRVVPLSLALNLS
jgi:hypothetical protein